MKRRYAENLQSEDPRMMQSTHRDGLRGEGETRLEASSRSRYRRIYTFKYQTDSKSL